MYVCVCVCVCVRACVCARARVSEGERECVREGRHLLLLSLVLGADLDLLLLHQPQLLDVELLLRLNERVKSVRV